MTRSDDEPKRQTHNQLASTNLVTICLRFYKPLILSPGYEEIGKAFDYLGGICLRGFLDVSKQPLSLEQR